MHKLRETVGYRLQKDSRAEFRGVFEQLHTRMCHFAEGLLPRGYDAEDVVQEAFLKVWELWGNFDSFDAIRSFLYTAIRNRCFNIYKHDKVVRKHGVMTSISEYSDSAGLLIEAEVLDEVNRAVQKLPVGCRSVLYLSYFEGLRNKDIAIKLDVSVNTVKTQKKRALHLLRGILKFSPFWHLLILLQYLGMTY
jgi:RNA polymerase sigma-70 factor (ECF subfamily)